MEFAGRFEAHASPEALAALRPHLTSMSDEWEWDYHPADGRIQLRLRSFNGVEGERRALGDWSSLDTLCAAALSHGVVFSGELRFIREDYIDDPSGANGGRVVMVDGRPKMMPFPFPLGPDAAPWWNTHKAREALSLPAPEGTPTPEEMDARWARSRHAR